MSAPLLSVLVTTFDRRELLIETLRSILDGADFPVEVIVGNANLQRRIDASFTGIDHPSVVYVNHPKQYWAWDNTRALLSMSTGRYVTSIADDDLYSRGFFAGFKTALELDPALQCYYTGYTSQRHVFDAAASAAARTFEGREFFDMLVEQRAMVMGNCGCFARDFLLRVDGFPAWETYFYPDTFQALHLAAHARRVTFVDAPLVFYRDHAGGTSSFNRPLKLLVDSQDEFLRKSVALIKANSRDRASHSVRVLVSRLIVPMYWHWRYVRGFDGSCGASTFRHAILQPYAYSMSWPDRALVEAANAWCHLKYWLKRAIGDVRPGGRTAAVAS
jgi:hypothetical protein